MLKVNRWCRLELQKEIIMRELSVFAASVILGFFLSGCDKQEEKHGHGGHSGPVAVPEHYADAVAKCEELSGKIGSLISSGKLSEVHSAAEEIQKIAEKMPEMAQKELAPEMLKEVNVKAKELAGMFHEIDGAADAGKKDETIKLHEKMKGLIADLKKHASHAGHK